MIIHNLLLGSYDTPGSAYGVAISGTSAYVADGDSGLQVIEKPRTLNDISFIDSGTIMATVPAGYRPGTYNLHVIDPDGGYAMLNHAFTVNYRTQQPDECVEDDSGSVDIGGVAGMPGREVRIPVVIKSTPGIISTFGFKVTYDENVLDISGYEKGDLTASFDFTITVIDTDVVSVGAFASTVAIPQGASGTLIWLKFMLSSGREKRCYPLMLDGLAGDLTQLSPSGGCLCIQPVCNGDLNGDGAITPSDALIAFKCYLGSGVCNDCTDVNGDGSVTPSEALCIFKKYLGQVSCID